MTRTRKRRPDPKREGAVMLVVMLVMLAVTALAVFAVHSTGFELRASGHVRQAMQARSVAQTGLQATLSVADDIGPQAILHSIEETARLSEVDRPVMTPFEPELDPSKDGYRIYSQDMGTYTTTGGSPVLRESFGASGGARQPYLPSFTVDVNDHYITQRAIPGQRADGLGQMRFLHATYTARGRMRLATGDYDALRSTDPREYHEAIGGSRAYGISGPFME